MYQPKKWWIGLPVLAGLAYYAAGDVTASVEGDIRRRVERRLSSASDAIDNPQAAVRGRDVIVSGVGLSPEPKDRAIADLRGEAGVRSVVDATTAVGLAKPFTLTLERHGAAATMSGNIPVAGERKKLRAEISAAGLDVSDKTAYASGAPTAFRDLTIYAVQRLAELQNGTVTLTDATLSVSGEARSGADYEKAIAALKAPPGGASVARADISPPRVAPYVFSAAIGDGMIALSGYLPSVEIRQQAVAKAAAAGAGAAVSDATQLASGAPKGDFTAALVLALNELSKLSQGKIVLSDAKLAIEGQGRDNVQAATLEAEVRDHLPQGFELARLDVAAGPVSPYVFMAQRSGDQVALTGYAPDETAHGRILDAARRHFFDASVVDRLTIAKGAPQNFVDAVDRSLRQLARLADGKLAIAGAEIKLEGVSRHQNARAEIERDFAANAPQGFRSEAQLSTRIVGSSLDAGQCRAAFADILVKAPIAFAPGEGAVLDESLAAVDALAATALRCQDAAIEVASHWDNFGIAEVNRDLTKRRAQAIVERMVKAGADPFKVTAAGYGGERPIAPNDSDDNRARNRRIEFIVK